MCAVATIMALPLPSDVGVLQRREGLREGGLRMRLFGECLLTASLVCENNKASLAS